MPIQPILVFDGDISEGYGVLVAILGLVLERRSGEEERERYSL